MSNPHPGTATRSKKQSPTPAPGVARKSPTVLKLEARIEELELDLADLPDLREEVAYLRKQLHLAKVAL